jgi:hypothetical protein
MSKAMARTTRLADRGRIEAHLRREPYLNLYGLGDLEPDQWPHTTWFGLEEGGRLGALALLYTRLSTPVLLALDGADAQPHLEQLVSELSPHLPPRFFAHLNLGLATLLAERFEIDSFDEHCKMAWLDRSRAAAVDTAGVVRLGPADAAEVAAFFAVAYPGNYFAPEMLALGPWMACATTPAASSVRAACTSARRSCGWRPSPMWLRTPTIAAKGMPAACWRPNAASWRRWPTTSA